MRALPRSLRLLNQRRLVERIARVGQASRAELADLAGMSRPTAGKIIDELLTAGVVEERDGDPAPGRLGRPGQMLGLESRSSRLLLVQLGVKRTDLAAVPLASLEKDPWAAAASFATPRSADTFLRKLDEARAGLKVRGPWAFALSMPGVVDEQSGRSLFNPNLHWTEGTNLVETLRSAWRIPGCVIQEIRALALGHLAVHDDQRDFLLVDADDGLGAAAVVNGQLFQGALPLAGELGHTRVAGNDRLCGCGAQGCVETLMARPGLLATFAQAEARRGPTWAELGKFLETRGDRVPAWLGEALEATAKVIGGALNVLGLDHVILSGAFTELTAPVQRRLVDAIAGSTLASRLGAVRVDFEPRQRARGLVHCLIDRLLIPTTDWSRPCVAA